jgi:transcriptional regulator with GAF, ATPase, and Fis domain
MADDAARTEQLAAELREARDRITALERREAALAAENAVLAAERSEALEQQTAMAEILRVIASSPTDAQPVLDAIVRSAQRLSGSTTVGLAILEGDGGRVVARDGIRHGNMPSLGAVFRMDERRPVTVAILERRTIVVPDLSDPAMLVEYPNARDRSPVTALTVPLIHEDAAIGCLMLDRTRDRRRCAGPSRSLTSTSKSMLAP